MSTRDKKIINASVNVSRMKKSLAFLVFLIMAVPCLMAQTGNSQQYKYVFTVAKDGTGDYKYIQDAIDGMRVFPLAPITL